MNNRTIKLLLALVVICLICAPYAAFADNVYATIRGVVTDASGAVVPDAKVTATNTATGMKFTTISKGTGMYEFLQLPIGPYTVSATKDGFKTFKSTEVTLKVNQVYEMPIGFQVGDPLVTIEVKADAVQVETTSNQLQTVINSQEIVDLPLIGRNFTQLEQLAPGVMSASDRFGTFSVNGSQSQQSSYLINGTDSNDIALNTALVIPSPDAIQEFNLISSTINPEYGRNSGGIVNAVIKNGTNKFHGSGFDFYRDTFLNTHNYFQKTTPVFHSNTFGGTVGGPIWKDKSFFFFSYQGARARSPIAGAGLVTVFSAAERNGNFNEVFSKAGFVQNTKKTPFAIVGDDNLSHPANTPWFAAGCAVPGCDTVFHVGPNFGVLPASALNPLAVSLMNKFVPSSNSANNQFTFNPNQTTKQDQEILRVDHNLTASDQLWGVAFLNHSPAIADLPFTGATLPGFGSINDSHTKEFTLSYTHTFNSNMLNEFRLGYARLNFDAVEPQTPTLPSALGFTGITPQNTAGAGAPKMTVTGFFTLGFSNNGPQPRKDQNYQATDNFSKIVGKHTMKFGFDARRFQVDNPFFSNNNGTFGFSTGAGNSAGNAGLNFLLGIPTSFAQGSGGPINARAYEYYAYAQDSWAIKSNLKINYGVGYEIDTPYNNNQFGGLAYNCIIPGQQSKIFPTAPAGLDFPGDSNCNSSGTSIKYGHFGPRFGFAYSPNLGKISGSGDKFSIRGGFGVYYNRTEEETALQNLLAPPFGLSTSGAGDLGGRPGFANPFADVRGQASTSEPNKFPYVPPQAGDTSIDFSNLTPLSINTNDPNLTTPYSMNFNLNIQRELPGNTVVSIGYVGALGRNLYRAYEGNSITAAGQAACAADPTCSSDPGNQHVNFPSHSPLPGDIFASVGTQHTDGTSSYHSMQVNVNKGMTHGLTLITSYTWSHAIDDGSGLENSGFGVRGTNVLVPSLNIGDSGNDARQRLVLGYVYQIPSLHHALSWAPDKLFGGWKLTGITTFQSGFPINLADSNQTSLTCDNFTFYGCPDNPNQVVASVKTLDPRSSSTNLFFDPASYAPANLGSYGNVRRDSIHGPGLNNTDFAILKDTKIREGMSLQVGLEGYNVFNHTQFCTPGNCVNGDIASPNFGRITSAAPGRLAQIRAKFTF